MNRVRSNFQTIPVLLESQVTSTQHNTTQQNGLQMKKKNMLLAFCPQGGHSNPWGPLPPCQFYPTSPAPSAAPHSAFPSKMHPLLEANYPHWWCTFASDSMAYMPHRLSQSCITHNPKTQKPPNSNSSSSLPINNIPSSTDRYIRHKNQPFQTPTKLQTHLNLKNLKTQNSNFIDHILTHQDCSTGTSSVTKKQSYKHIQIFPN